MDAGGLRIRSTKGLNFLSSHFVDLICIQESNLNSSSSFQIPGFSALRSHRNHSRSGILSHDAMHSSSSVIIFIRQGLSFSTFSTSSLSSLDPYSNYVGINIFLTTSSSSHFLMFMLLLIRYSLTDSRTDSFSPSILSSFRNLFILRDFNCHHLLCNSRGTSDPRGEKVFDQSFPLTSSPSITLTYLLFFIAPLAVASPLTFPLLPPLLPYLASGKCLRIWVLITYQFY